MKLIHISDLHIGKSEKQNNKVKHFLDGIKRKHSDLSALLITGDITNDGTKEQYKIATNFLQDFNVIVCPGNHDYGRIGNFFSEKYVHNFMNSFVPYRNCYNFFWDKYEIVAEVSCWDSCLHTTSILDFARGKIGKEQLENLKFYLDSCGDDVWRIVLLHHKPFSLSWYEQSFMKLEDAKEFLEIVEPRADVVCYGHSGANFHKGKLIKTSDQQKEIHYLDANSCISEQSYFLIELNKNNLDISVGYV